MTLATWFAFLLTETMLCFVPGPAVLYVVAQGMGRGRPAATAGNLGVVSGNLVYFALSATGLGAIIVASHDLFLAIRWIGAAYLVWLGIGAIMGKAGPLAVRPAEPAGGWRVWRGAVLLQLANPKALLFFVALLPQFIDPAGNIAMQVAILGITSVFAEFLVLSLYGAAAARASGLTARPGFARWTNRIAGSLLIAAGVGMAAVRRVG